MVDQRHGRAPDWVAAQNGCPLTGGTTRRTRTTPPWPPHLQTDDEINAWIYTTNHERSVRDVLDQSQHVFEQLIAAIEGLPDEVLLDVQHHLPWLAGHPFNAAEFFAHFHEEHEPDMRAWLTQMEKP